MISRKENLLLRPWQQKRYENHRRKVQSALPVIDNKPPATRQHVNLKLKKQQKEMERSRRIEYENYLLLRKMNYIMRTSRVDNYWRTPLPNFLNRIAIYDNIIPEMIDLSLDDDSEALAEKNKDEKSQRELKCYACTPKKPKKPTIPEERVPWEPEKKPVRRQRSKSVPILGKTPSLPFIKEKAPKSAKKLENLSQSTKSNKKTDTKDRFKSLPYKSPQSIILSRGALELCVNFPSDTTIKFQNGRKEKILSKVFCNCKKQHIIIN